MSSIELIEEIKNLVREDKIIISKHAYARMVERDVSADDLVNLILNGEIIESYPDVLPMSLCAHVRVRAWETMSRCCG